MVAISLRFPAGRYHATPWGRHVNEAAVEWPPSAWRLLRALVGTWFARVDPGGENLQPLRNLVRSLAGVRPIYHLPQGVQFHLRHYIPVRDNKRDAARPVFDGFMALDRDAPLDVAWPEVTLPPDAQAALDRLLPLLGYLGRAESWIQAQAVGDPAEPNCRPAEGAADVDHASVALLVPRAWGDYQHLADTAAQAPEQAGRKRRKRGGAPPALPTDLFEALRVDTGEWRAQGWNLPPAAEWVEYRLPLHLLRPRRLRPPARPPRPVRSVRLALDGRPLPRVEDALRVGELARVAAMSCYARLFGEASVPPVLSGHDLEGAPPHSHAFYLPVDSDDDGRIDHLLVHAAGGLDACCLQALDGVRRLWEAGGAEWLVRFDGHDGGPEGSDGLARHLGWSREWVSVTPYLHPWFRKPKLEVADQIARELRARGWPPPVEMVRLDAVVVHGRPRRPVHFRRFRSRRGLSQPDCAGSFWRLRFPEPVQGPLALGFACHYGLGLFTPVRTVPEAPGSDGPTAAK